MPQKPPRVSQQDGVVLVGLALVTLGAWALVGWAALMVPGVALVWYGLPARPPFIDRR